MRIALRQPPTDERCSPLRWGVLKLCCRRGGHWPSACENSQRRKQSASAKQITANTTGRADAITTRAILDANWRSAKTELPLRRGAGRADAVTIISILNADSPRHNFTIESILTLGYNVPYTGIISFALPCASKTAKMPV